MQRGKADGTDNGRVLKIRWSLEHKIELYRDLLKDTGTTYDKLPRGWSPWTEGLRFCNEWMFEKHVDVYESRWDEAIRRAYSSHETESYIAQPVILEICRLREFGILPGDEPNPGRTLDYPGQNYSMIEGVVAAKEAGFLRPKSMVRVETK